MVTYWWSNFWINVDRAAEEALGLTPGLSFRVELDDFAFDVVYAGEARPEDMQDTGWVSELAGNSPEFCVAYRPLNHPDGPHALNIVRVVSTRPFPIHERWMPASLTLLTVGYKIPSRGTE